MEVWSNIWTALSTPNEGLVNFLLIPCGFIENLLMTFIFIYFLNVKATRKQIFLYVFLTSILGILSMSFIPEPYNAFINYVLVFIINNCIFKLNFIKTILVIIIPTIMWALIGTLTLNPFIKVLNINFTIVETIPIYRISYLFISYIIMYLIVKILKNKVLYILVLEELDKKSKRMLIINLILGFVMLSIQFIISLYYTDVLPLVISLLSFCFLLAYFSINIYSLIKTNQLYLTAKQLHNAEEYNKTLQILHDNIRGFKHDYDNTVAAIGGYIKTDDLEGLKQYYSQLEEECVKVNRLYMLNPNIINNPGIYSLLTTKYNEAEELNIKMNITVLWDLSKINMKIYEFTKILGILVDNAIDAAKETEQKIINITFKDDEKNNMQYLKIENSYVDKDVDIDAIFEKGKTSKENHTGLGLWEIRKILKSNNNLNLHTTKDDKYFTQQFEIYN